MENILIVDESKTKTGSIYIFACILFKDATTFFHVNEKLVELRLKPFYQHIKELKGSKISNKIPKLNENLFNESMSILAEYYTLGLVSFRFFIMKGNDFIINGINIEDKLKNTLANITYIDRSDTQKYFYFQLSYFIIAYLNNLPFPGDFLGKIISDDIYCLEKNVKKQLYMHNNYSIGKSDGIHIVPSLVENLHNILISTSKHYGLNAIDFENSIRIPTIQICDYVSNFMLGFFRYYYYKNNNICGFDKFELKKSITERYFKISNKEKYLKTFGYKDGDIIANDDFDPIYGALDTVLA